MGATIDAARFRDALAAAEARLSEVLEERDAVRGAGNALLDVALAERDAAEADADALAEALRFHNRTPSGNVRRCLPECVACAAIAAHDARRQP